MKQPKIRIRPMTPPPDEAVLQPLREVGSATKTCHWDLDDIQSALREANRRGIAVETLFASRHTPHLPAQLRRVAGGR